VTVADTQAAFEARTYVKVAWRIIPLLLAGYILAYLDRVNVGFAKLQMASDLQFSDAVYGFGAGVFFIGYFLFEVPSNLILRKLGARLWMARIMITWGIISAGFMFTGVIAWGPISAAFGCTDAEFSFYVLRFLLGVAEAGFFPGAVLYFTYWFPAQRRAQFFAFFMIAGGIAGLIGGPLSGAILQFMDGAGDLRGWQWLFLIEGLPTVFVGLLFLFYLPEGPRTATWLAPEERDLITRQIAEEEAGKSQLHERHSLREAFADWRLWALAIIWLCGTSPGYAIAFWTPTIISELGANPGNYFEVGLLMIAPNIVVILSQLWWARHSDQTGERRFHSIAGLAVMIVGMILLALVENAPIVSLIALTMIMSGSVCWVVTFWSLPPMFLSGAAAAAGIAWISSIGSLGGYIGPDLIGRIRAASEGNADVALYALAGALLLGALITLFMPEVRAKPAS
jgi:MFS family permease